MLTLVIRKRYIVRTNLSKNSNLFEWLVILQKITNEDNFSFIRPTSSSMRHKSVFSLLRKLSTWCCPHLLLRAVLRHHCCWAPARRASIAGAAQLRSILPVRLAPSSKPTARSGTVLQRSIDVTDRQTDGHRTVTLTLPHTMPAAQSINGPGTSFQICRYQKLDAEMSIWACKSTTESSLF